MVEFFLFILQEYHPDLNYDKKEVFGDVHFALFYTAIFNSLQSMILAFAVRRISKRMWIRAEELELGHYVEVREEFERVSQRVEEIRAKRRAVLHPAQNQSSPSTSSCEHEDGENDATKRNSGKRHLNSILGFNDGSWRDIFYRLWDLLRYPQLMQQYNSLLIQVRFHELRVHFLQAYNLPPKLKVSDYLRRCELSVLIKLVHVSSMAWLLLTASMNCKKCVRTTVSTIDGEIRAALTFNHILQFQ